MDHRPALVQLAPPIFGHFDGEERPVAYMAWALS